MSERQPAFEVKNPAKGDHYKIYADGRIEGFGAATLIINRIPALIALACEPMELRVEELLMRDPEPV